MKQHLRREQARRGTLRRILGPLLLSSLLLGMLDLTASGATATAAAACSVPSLTYPTIQSAVNDPNCDPINVAPGIYNEQVTINRTVTLNGAQAGVDARTRAGAESIIQDVCGPVLIEADKVVLDGFTIQGATVPSDPCFFAGIWTNPGFSSTNGGHQIRNNIIQNNIIGVYLNNDGTFQTTVERNLVRDNIVAGPASGNGIYSDLGLNNAVIDSNKFSGHTNSSIEVFGGASVNATNNELVAGALERIVLGGVSTATISGNVSMGSTSSGTIRLFGGDSGVTVNSNTLFNGMRAIRVDDCCGFGANTTISAHFNCIDGNTIAGLEVEPSSYTGTLNAENNWWGSPSGPTNPNNSGGSGDAVIDPDGVVDFTPFLKQCPTAPPGNPQKDLVAGTGTIMSSGDVVHVNASRNPNTSAISGRFYVRYSNNAEIGGRVTCLTVNLNRAGVGGVIERVKGTPPGGNEVLITVLDMGEPGTLDEVNAVKLSGASMSCPSTGPTFPINKGNYVVHADPPLDLLSGLDTLIAQFETAANCSSSDVCSGTGEFVAP